MYSRTARKKEKKRKKKTALLPFYMSGGVCKSLQHRRSLRGSTSTSPSGVQVIICIMRSDEVQCCCMTQIPTAH